MASQIVRCLPARPLSWWWAAGALVLCTLAMALPLAAALGPDLPDPLHMLCWRFVHFAPTGFEFALVALLSLDVPAVATVGEA